MTSLRTVLALVALLVPSMGLAAKTILDTRMSPQAAMAWIQANKAARNQAKSTDTVKVYTLKDGELIIDDVKPDSVHFRIVKN